ncbi:cation:proton antiporter [Turicibacter bilis]|uniref:Cation:proton antiporter n=2 Tax=Turicibacter bilis TaxID=2735723 RepID=A0ABY5JP88_9FIRM|nr:cation:proton antiporter [Turicibacter bilis]MBS3200883.1 cation:proton antiporter [Turicibacter bilis]MBS3201860.1 cation:proton antiporter [Turicibacter bilis]UUF07300.1 cation:proton antiporter [Turicibacter bilis]UUF12050.1 cation:proton antiporter [Turicibacter bilis]
MTLIIVLISLLIIGILAHYSGKLIEYIKLPSLIGMMLIGMLIGPSFLNLVPDATLTIAPTLKDIALVTVLFIGGLGISVAQMKQIGRPAILLSAIPATLEGFTIALMAMLFLKFSFIQGAILGFIIAAVSPAVLIPSMIDLINRKVGQDKAIPQMLLVGASADDTIAITLFTTFLGIYMQTTSGEAISVPMQLLMIPLTIIISVAAGFIVYKLSKPIIEKISSSIGKVIVAFGLCLLMRAIEKYFHLEIFNSLLTVMLYGFFIRNYVVDSSQMILNQMNRIWKTGKLYLFAFVGMAINPTLVGEFFLIGCGILAISLSVRSIGVLISLIGTNLSFKERIFCVIAYLPKATVQSAKAAIPMQMGVAGGEIMQAIAILSVLITAPIGAIGIKLTSDRLLQTEN